MNYFTSDLHIFHKNVVGEIKNFDNRPFKTLDEMHETILNNFNSILTNGDHLYLLGDIVWKINDESIALMSQFKSCLHLICGNHENLNDQRYKRLFYEIVDYKEIKDNAFGKQYGLVLFHYPIFSWNKMRGVDKNGNKCRKSNILLYGHTHNSLEDKLFQDHIKNLNDNYNYGCQAYNVGCMLWNYTPVTLEQIINSDNDSIKSIRN